MANVASRDLRNHTAAVLKQVAEGVEVTITVRGEPAAVLTPPRRQRPPGVPKAALSTLHARQAIDPTLTDDLAWISEGTTDQLGPLR